jgi:hypothetical protein
MKKIVISKEFSDTPGGRFIRDGQFSGEKFRNDFLEPLFSKLGESEVVLIDFDGGYGYPTSFLEESFGGLARKFGSEKVLKKLKFKSDEEPDLINEVKEYIKNAK